MRTEDPGTAPAFILITGASSGIGAALARAFAARGEALVLTARRLERLEALAAELRQLHGVAVEIVPCDLAQPGAAACLHAELQRRGLPLKGLVNNAGFGLRGDFEALDPREAQRMLQVLVQAVVELSQIALPEIGRQPDGFLLNVASLAGVVPGLAGSALYSACKAFLIRFSQSLAAEQGEHGVRVLVLCPGYVHTEFHAQLGAQERIKQLPGWFWMEADDLARRCLRALDGQAVVVVPGLWNQAIALLARLLPEPLGRWLSRRFSRRYRRVDRVG
ncbi:MAG: SDR family NAD(P)-dependent oxidoreductase [Synechococcaceae cyanobacterium]